MKREEVRNMLATMFGNNSGKIQFGFPMKDWRASESEEVDGRLIHQWLMENLDPGESFKSHDGSMALDRLNDEILGHYDSGRGIWVFTFGRIQYFRKPRAFAGVSWKDLTRDKIGNNLTRGLSQNEGEDYLAVFSSVDSPEVEWVKIQDFIQTHGLPVHLPMAIRFLHWHITRWIRTYDSSMLKTVLERNDEYYGDKLGEINWLSSIFEQPLNADKPFHTSLFSITQLVKFNTSTRDVKAVREIWREYQTVTNRTDQTTPLSEAVYVNVSIQYQKLAELGRQLFNTRKSSERRAVPVVSSGENLDHFALVSTEAKLIALHGKFMVPTAPLAADGTHDLIGISTYKPAMDCGFQKQTDDLAPNLSVRQLYYQSVEDPEAILKIRPPCHRLTKPIEGNSRELLLHLAFLELIGNDVVHVLVTGQVNVEFANISVSGSPIVRNGISYKFVGYDLNFERTSSPNITFEQK
jgi:hypothetical protein